MKKHYRIATMILAGLMLFGSVPIESFAQEADADEEYILEEAEPTFEDDEEYIIEEAEEEETPAVEVTDPETEAITGAEDAPEEEPVLSEAANSLTEAQVRAWLDNEIALGRQRGGEWGEAGECTGFCNWYLTNCWGLSIIYGDARDWRTQCPSGWTVVNLNGSFDNCRIGDLLVEDYSPHGHVSVYYGKEGGLHYVVDQNNNGRTVAGKGRLWANFSNPMYCFRPPFGNDSTPPVISNVQVEQDHMGYTVTCTVTDSGTGVDRVQFPSWTVNGGQDDIAANWQTNSAVRGTKNGNTYTFRMNRSDHNYEYGSYATHIYAWDKAGNYSAYYIRDIAYLEDTTGPTISNVRVISQDANGYTVSCQVTDSGVGVDRVQFPSWTLYNEQDDLDGSWTTSTVSKGSKNGSTWTFRVNRSAHNNEFGTYRTHIYAYDGYGNRTKATVPDVIVTFSDTRDASAFYFDPVIWAANRGITTGFSDGTFRPWTTCNRASVVTFLWRIAGSPRVSGSYPFSDPTSNSDFNMAITWAVQKGIVTGFSDGTFRPWNTCNRAAIVTFLWRYAGRPAAGTSMSFSDMTTNSEFNTAIRWAARNGITTGYDDGTFRPWNDCNRASVVTFLYRYAQL